MAHIHNPITAKIVTQFPQNHLLFEADLTLAVIGGMMPNNWMTPILFVIPFYLRYVLVLVHTTLKYQLEGKWKEVNVTTLR
jgi:hypothetical protein